MNLEKTERNSKKGASLRKNYWLDNFIEDLLFYLLLVSVAILILFAVALAVGSVSRARKVADLRQAVPLKSQKGQPCFYRFPDFWCRKLFNCQKHTTLKANAPKEPIKNEIPPEGQSLTTTLNNATDGQKVSVEQKDPIDLWPGPRGLLDTLFNLLNVLT